MSSSKFFLQSDPSLPKMELASKNNSTDTSSIVSKKSDTKSSFSIDSILNRKTENVSEGLGDSKVIKVLEESKEEEHLYESFGSDSEINDELNVVESDDEESLDPNSQDSEEGNQEEDLNEVSSLPPIIKPFPIYRSENPRDSAVFPSSSNFLSSGES